jgi:hypothetical protein
MYNYFEDHKYEVGQEVEIRSDESQPWTQGTVASLDPLTVSQTGDTDAHEWAFVRPLQVKKNYFINQNQLPSSFV